MPFVDHEMTHLLRTDPVKASARIVDAYRRAKCLQKGAAKILGTTAETLIRWIRALDGPSGGKLRARLDRLKAEAKRQGWHHDRDKLGGRPRGSKSRPRAEA
jgi:hypothetical protein